MSIVLNSTDHRMQEIAEKVEHEQRLTLEDGIFLYESDDILTIGQLANKVNLRKNGKKVYFIENMSLYFTNICEAHCSFCNFRKDQGEEGSYTLSGPEMIAYVEKNFHPGVREFHIMSIPFVPCMSTILTLRLKLTPLLKLNSSQELVV